MGAVSLVGGPGTDPAGRPTQGATTGNPHLVVRCEDPADVDLEREGAALAAGYPEGINVEYVANGPGPDEITLRVFERGVGETAACGSGSCAAAAVARSWGWVGDRVLVRNPGGSLEVSLGEKDGDPVLLTGPVRRVALVEVDRAVLL
jgi:diaminopimelate epimerase